MTSDLSLFTLVLFGGDLKIYLPLRSVSTKSPKSDSLELISRVKPAFQGLFVEWWVNLQIAVLS